LYQTIDDWDDAVVFRVKRDSNGKLNAKFSVSVTDRERSEFGPREDAAKRQQRPEYPEDAKVIAGLAPYSADDFLTEIKSFSDSELDEKLHLADEAHTLFPANADILSQLISAYRTADRLIDLSHLLHAQFTTLPQDINLLRSYSEGLLILREWAKATEIARKIVELEPNNPKNLTLLAYRLVDQEQYN